MQTTARVLDMSTGASGGSSFRLGFGFDGKPMEANYYTGDPYMFSLLSRAFLSKQVVNILYDPMTGRIEIVR